MTQLPRAITAGELALLRSNNQQTRLYLTVHSPTTIYSALLNGVPDSTDSCLTIDYDNGSGTHTNILPDMTLYVGTSAGAYDLGMARIRNTSGIGATSGSINIGEESEINWADNCFLTVVDEFGIWPRHISIVGTTPYIDQITYAAQNTDCDPVVVMGTARVAWLRDATVTLAFDASNSWTLNNTVTAYAWAFPGADSYTNETTATPTATYDATGTYRVSCTVTTSDASTFTGYRYIFIVSDSTGQTTDFKLDSLEGSQSSNGWSCAVTLYDDATKALIRDRALCILHTVDYYNGVEGSIGFEAGAENILYIGWIAGESITRGRDGNYSTVAFDIQSTPYWLGRITGFPVGLKDRTTTPTKWTRFLGLTPYAIVWHMIHWRSTLDRCCDVFPLANTYRTARIEAPGAQSLFDQLKELEYTTVRAQPISDRLGRLFNEVEQQLLPTATRAAIATNQTLTTNDWTGEIEIERSAANRTSLVDLSGVAYDGTTPTVYASLSPGQVYRISGGVEVVDRLALYDQATTNTLCGMYSGWKNNEWPRFAMQLASQHRFVDVAPYQYYSFSLAAADSPRGVAYSGRIIPRSVRYDWRNPYFTVNAEFEAESFEQLAITKVMPTIEVTPIDEGDPIDPPPPDPLPNSDAKEMWVFVYDGADTHALWSGDYFNGGQPTWNKITLTGNHCDWMGITSSGRVYVHTYTSNETGFFPAIKTFSIDGAYTGLVRVSALPIGHIATGTNYTNPMHIIGYNDKFYTTWRIATQGDPGEVWWCYGKYSPTGWDAFQNMGDFNVFQPELVADNLIAFGGNVYNTVSASPPALDSGWEAWTGTGAWRNKAGDAYWVIRATIAGTVYLKRNGNPGYTLGSAVNPDQAQLDTRLSGAKNGTHVFCVSGVDDTYGQLLYAADGATFTSIATWLPGQVWDAKFAGGGSLVWTPNTIVANNVPTRLYTAAGSVIRDMTGNFWSLVSGNQTVIGSGLVY